MRKLVENSTYIKLIHYINYYYILAYTICVAVVVQWQGCDCKTMVVSSISTQENEQFNIFIPSFWRRGKARLRVPQLNYCYQNSTESEDLKCLHGKIVKCLHGKIPRFLLPTKCYVRQEEKEEEKKQKLIH